MCIHLLVGTLFLILYNIKVSCLAALPTVPDALSVVVPSRVTEQVISDCIDLKTDKVWIKPGSESAEAIRHGKEHGIAVIHDRSVLIHSRPN